MSRTSRWFLLVVGILLFIAPSAGRSVSAAGTPVLLQLEDGYGGDIYAYENGSLKNLTSYGYNGVPILSPDGKSIVYASTAQTYLDDMRSGNGRSGAVSINIWLMDMSTGKAKRIADQPADTRPAGSTLVRPFTSRSNPRWSPDSTYIVWMEASEGTPGSQNDPDEHMIRYTVSSGQQTDIYKQAIFGEGQPSQPEWPPAGISIVSTQDIQGPSILRLLDSSGKIMSQTLFDNDPLPILWLNGESSPTLIAGQQLVQITGDTRSNTLPPMEVYSLSAPDGIRFVSDSGYYGTSWSLLVPGAAPVRLGNIYGSAISPDGTMAAYIYPNGAVFNIFDGRNTVKIDVTELHRNGTLTTMRDTQSEIRGLVWSALGIRIHTGQ